MSEIAKQRPTRCAWVILLTGGFVAACGGHDEGRALPVPIENVGVPKVIAATHRGIPAASTSVQADPLRSTSAPPSASSATVGERTRAERGKKPKRVELPR